MEAFAIKSLDGSVIGVGLDEAKAWAAARIPSLLIGTYIAEGYRCVPVQITEGWIPVGIIKDEMSKDDGAAIHYADLSVHLPVGTKLYAELPPPPKEGK